MAARMPVSNRGLAKLQIEAVLTVPPLTVTEPRRVRQVLGSDPDVVDTATNFQGCYQIVLYYQKAKEDKVGWFLAGWIVESLGKAVLEHPILAGRLQRRDEGEGEVDGRKRLEIVSNDSGIRMVEARMPISMSQFLELSEKDDVEAELVFWKEIDEHRPEFSPLFYVQVTKFKCGGYSVGISCSLLLAEIFIADNFLTKWAEIHCNILPQSQHSETPIFYPPRLLSYESPPTDIISRTPTKNGAHSFVFKITARNVNSNMEFYIGLAMLCLEEAEKKLDRKMGSEHFSLFVAESCEVLRIKSCSRSENSVRLLELKNEISCTSWDDFGDCEVEFHEGNKAALVSRWIGPVSDGHVMAIPSPNKGASALIVVTLPFQD